MTVLSVDQDVIEQVLEPKINGSSLISRVTPGFLINVKISGHDLNHFKLCHLTTNIIYQACCEEFAKFNEFLI